MKRTKLILIMLIVALFMIFSCSKENTGPDNAKPGKPSNPNPENNATDVSLTTTFSWECVDPEGDILTYDIYFGTSPNPSYVNSVQSVTTYDPGTLNLETTYYWKIIANDDHSNSTTGDIWQFISTGTVTDIDGNIYQTVQIGNQIWMAENLKVTHYQNGDAVPHLTDNGDWQVASYGAYCVYGNTPSNADTYGNLYNWHAVDDSRGLAPEGWHIPTDEEIKELEMYLGMSQSQANSTGWRGTNEGSKLAGNADLWNNGDLENDPEFGSSGFSFLPGGYRNFQNGNFYSIDNYSYFWSATEYNTYFAWRRYLSYDTTQVYLSSYSKQNGYSVRCVKD
jgi:uncharacterized protein (TIGR02145 family)